MENLPIDIHSNKLLDWLISRRHCPRDWRTTVEDIRAKISHAIQDMPEHERILQILSTGQYINYFHCAQILEILRETEKETKNIFGIYSSQRMKDWKEIVSLYEKGGLYLAEAANFLQRFVQYEVPALRKQIAKAENTARESERKEQDYAKQAAESRRAFERELAKWALSGQRGDLRLELLGAADGLKPTELAIESELRQLLYYFEQFSNFVGKDTGELFPFIRFLLSSLDDGSKRSVSELSVFEWRYGRKPNVVLAPIRSEPLTALTANGKDEDDEIDFGDDETDIDLCDNGASIEGIELVKQEHGQLELKPSVEAGIARGEEALPVLEHLGVRRQFLDELDQLVSFLHFRLQDELAESAASIYLSAITHRPAAVNSVSVEALKTWLATLQRTIDELDEPNRMQLLRFRTSPHFVDDVVAQLEQKRRLEAKYKQLEQLSAQKQQQCAEEIRGAQKLLDGVIEAAKTLQEQLEKDLSKRYSGREVYIMGEINAVLYGS